MYCKRSNPNYNGSRCDKALRIPALNCQMEDCENKDRLSVCRVFLLQRTPKLDRTKPSTGLRVGHNCSREKLLCNLSVSWPDKIHTFSYVLQTEPSPESGQ